jgi:outer membrane protein TolC
VVEKNVKAYGLVKIQYEVGKIDMLDLLAVQSKWVQERIAPLYGGNIKSKG